MKHHPWLLLALILKQRTQGCKEKASWRCRLWSQDSILARWVCKEFNRWPGRGFHALIGLKLFKELSSWISLFVMCRDNGGSLSQSTWIRFCFSRYVHKSDGFHTFIKSLFTRFCLIIIISFLLVQMGKFYELFEMDAHVGAKELDLQYMKVGLIKC